MNVIEELKKYTDLVPLEKLQKRVEKPTSLCSEEIKHLIPSIIMGGDGPVLGSLFLLTDSYIFEVRLMPQGEHFDYVARKTITNYRFILSEHIIKREGKEDLKYEVATIRLIHNVAGVSSDLSYVGNNREAWIKMVAEAIPISILKQ
jgi:hypothetical protein